MSSNPSDSFESGNSTSIIPLSPEKLQELFYGFRITQAVYVAAQLGLADCLQNGAKSIEELVTELNVNAKVFQQLMRLLIHLGIVTVDDNKQYHLTPVGSFLCSNTPHSRRGSVLSAAEYYPVWGNLLHSVRTGKGAFEQTFQMSYYEYLAQNAEANVNFNLWMKESNRDFLLPFLGHYDFSSFKHFVDIGGGSGMLTTAILNRYPHLQATIFDQAHVIKDAQQLLDSAGITDRCQLISGDFFDSIPAGRDLYILSRVLLDWDDTHALAILKNCRAAMEQSSKLLIIDHILPRQNETLFQLSLSLELLVLFEHLTRTEDEFYELLAQAGLQVSNLIKTESAFSFLEATTING